MINQVRSTEVGDQRERYLKISEVTVNDIKV